MRIKIRHDGQRLIIPPVANKRNEKYEFRALIHRIKGAGYDLKWNQDSPDLGIMKGDIIYNVPYTMFRKDMQFIGMNEFMK